MKRRLRQRIQDETGQRLSVLGERCFDRPLGMQVSLAALCGLLLVAPARAADLPSTADASQPFAGAPIADGVATVREVPKYNRDVRPILSHNCFQCHGPDSAARKADLRLDRRDDAVTAGAIVPGDLEQSEMIRRLTSTDPEERMPPAGSHRELKPEEIDLLGRWVAAGAEYEPHWSLIAPVRPAPPAVADEAWVRTPIDRFVLAKLEAAGLKPAPEADRRTIARRLSLDLTGLPPDPAIVDEFVADQSADAYEKLVDRLMTSPAWGEHRGRYWLDVARYADTHGIHFDNYREMWSYRDAVIAAFNRNQPFDQFTIEQLAGDLLPNPSLDQQVASGFNRCNITTNEGGAIAEEYLVLYARDRTETTSAVWLGLTTGCAVCHDHKFDPLTQKEFYSLSAFFNNTTQNAMDGNIKDTPPTVPVPQEADRPRWEALPGEIAAARARADERRQVARADFDSWLTAQDMNAVVALVPDQDLYLRAELDEKEGSAVEVLVSGEVRQVPIESLSFETGHVAGQVSMVPPGSLSLADVGDFEKDQPFSCAAWVKVADPNQSGSLLARMDNEHEYRGWDLWLENGQVASHLVHKWPDDALKTVSKSKLEANRWTHVLVTYDGSGSAEGVKIYFNGAAQPTDIVTNKLQSSIKTEVPFKLGQRHSGQQVAGLALQDLRLYKRSLTPAEAIHLAAATRALYLATKPAAERADAETQELFEWWLNTLDIPFQEVGASVAKLEAEKAAIQQRGTIAHVMHERGDQAMAFVLHRGDYDKRRDEVRPQTPSMLPPMSESLPRNRLGFAQWLLQPEHPLTARVSVNRFWQELYGTGLVRTSGDFGITGELPSHPELLDWLAVEFRESGWDMKKFYKLLVTSAAYRQSAAATPEKLEKDPANRLLSRGPRFRMDAEMVRDYALAASGLMSKKIGGPSVRPYQPEGVWEAVAMIGSNTRDYRHDQGENLYRRSMYTIWKRAAPPASMDILNAPAREVCTTRRERTNTPLQALVTLNDPQFVEAARHLAELAIKDGGASTAPRLEWLGKRLAARPWRTEEVAVIAASLADLLSYYVQHPDDAKALIATGESKPDASLDAPTLAAWTMLANELMNLDEVLNK
jgi:mono/diheme cytochrome c family protein